MATATYKHGRPVMVDHTPTSAVSAGDVIESGDVVRIAHLDIPADQKGALAAGGGVYTLPKATGSGKAIGAGKQVYWDATNEVATASSGSGANNVLGVTEADSVDGDETALVQHVAI